MLLKLGSKGDDVRCLQEKLGLKADGSFGTGTEKAVKEWQKKNGLTVDGVIGDKSWSLLTGIKREEAAIPESQFRLENLKGHIPDSVIAQIPATAAKFNITNNLRLAHFLSQCAHESGDFKWVVELASGKAYEGRKDLGNTEAGDGVRFKGRGYIQCTGRVNYSNFSKFIGEDCVTNPDLVSTKYPMASAAWFFDKNNLWKICDQGSTDDVVTKVSRRVNGGTNGLVDRQKKFDKFWSLLK